MELLLLSARPGLEVNGRLVAAAAERGAKMRVADLTRMVAKTGGEPVVLEGRRPVGDPAAVLARVGNWRPASALAVLEVFEHRGVPTPNRSRSIRAGRDHWRTAALLGQAGLAVPPTVAGSDPGQLAAVAVEELGLPVVVKQRRSRMGVGVILCRRRDHLEAVLDSLWRVGDEVVVQAFQQTRGVSFRVFVVDGAMVAAARFEAPPGEWRSNAARGARVKAWRPNTEAVELALGAASVLGLGVSAVDLLPGDNGLVVGEVNPSPGFLALQEATGADVAGAIVEYLIRLGR